jgi:predicted hotdog family 3-hydroxylacyl-ACP dehydratase
VIGKEGAGMTPAMRLERPDFEHLIPHAGDMCLLARVVACSETSILCEADNHADPTNPLRNARGLPVSAGIEYAAQAMALHAALQKQDRSGAIQSGAIAVLSDVAWRADFLDGVAGPLSIEATLLAGTGGGRQYSFAVGPNGQPLITGTVVVAFT